MKRLVLLVLFGVAAWYAWHHWRDLTQRRPQHDLEVRNTSSSSILRLRATVAGQTFVKDTLPPGSSATWHFGTSEDTGFELVWEWGDKLGEMHWSGGHVPRGPIVRRHVLSIDGDGGVVYTVEDKLGAASGQGSSPTP